MLLRFVLSLLIITLGSGLLLAFRGRHGRRASRLTDRASMDRPTLLYFRSDVCAPCLTQTRYLNTLKRQFGPRLAVQKIDADHDRETADRYGIFTLPTTLVVDRGGQVTHINYGLTPAGRLARQLENIL